MIHVAEAGEAKGRVVVQLCSSRASPIAIEAAVWLARAFQSEIESLYVENLQLIDLARYPFACEVSLTGRTRHAISCDEIERQFRFESADFHAAIAICARAAEVPIRPRVMRDDPVQALRTVCSECGPWSAVALAEPFTSASCPSLKDLLDTVADATGLLVVGPQARRTTGPIVVALEQAELLSALLGAADRMASTQEAEILVCPIAAGEAELAEIEGAARLVLAERANTRMAASTVTLGSEAAAVEVLRRLQPGLVIGQFGGLLVPVDGDLRPLAAGLECPLLLMR